MFTKFLRLFLYLILSGCIIWGAVLIGAPSALKFILNRALGEHVTLYNVRITPKLNIIVSRIDFNGIKYQNEFLDGSIKSLEMKMTGLLKFRPVLDISVGQIRLENVASIGKAQARFNFPKISLDGKVNVELEFEEILAQHSVLSEYLAASGHLDLRNGVLLDANITAGNTSSLRGLDLSFSAMTGSLSDWHFLTGDASLPGLLDFEFRELEFLNRTITVKNATVSSELSSEKYNVIVSSDDFMDQNNNHVARGVSAYLSTKSSDAGKIEKITLTANSITLPPSRFLESSEVIDLSIDLMTDNDFDYEFFANGKLAETNLMAENFPIADLSNTNFELSSKYALNGDASSELETVLKLYSEKEKSVSVDALASLDIIGNNLFDCMRGKCIFLNFLLDYDLMADQDKLGGFFSCLKFPCKHSVVDHEIVTDNTNSFFESATNSRVFSPIFLAFLYRTLLAGEQVGDGHSFQF